MKKIKNKQEENTQMIKEIVRTSAKILSKDKKALKFLTYSYLFTGSLSSEYDGLRKMDIKERRKVIAKKWILYKKEKGIKFDSVRDREVVDSITRILGINKGGKKCL